jgi:predicted permease
MSWFLALRRRISEALASRAEDEDLRVELRDHFEREVQRQLREGVPPDEARRQAAIRTGGALSAREAVRDERTGRLLQDAAADLRFAARTLRRNPGFAASVVISLALGVGGTTAIFGVVNAVLLRPLPYPGADNLFNLRIWWQDFSSTLSPADLGVLDEIDDTHVSLGAYFRPDDGFAMQTENGPQLVSGAIVTDGLPGVLGIHPVLGAGFSRTPNAPEALISATLWRDRYAASAEAIGRPIVLDGDTYTVVGVMPAGFNVPGQRDGAAWLKATTRQPTRRGPYYLTTIVRLGTGVTPDTAAARLTSAVSPVLQAKFAVEPNWQYRLRPLKDTIVGDLRQTLFLLLAAMALVLLIAVVNVTNLLLARGGVRARELAIRASLGAGRGRLVRHLLAESALLGSIAGIAGLGLAAAVHRFAGTMAQRIVPRMNEVALDGTVLIFAVVCGAASGIVAGTLPAVRLPWHRLASSLRDSGRSATEGAGRGRTRQALVIVQLGLTVAVLTGAVLLAKSFVKLQSLDPGFRPDGLMTFRLSLPDDPYSNEERLAVFLAELEGRLRGVAGIKSVAYSISLPPDLLVVSNNYTVEGSAAGSQGASGVAEWNVVSGAYFSTMGVRMIAGRTFTAADRGTSPAVAIVNESFVRRHYPQGNAIGGRLKGGDWDPAEPWTTIVGIAGDVPYGRGLWGGADATVYRPYAQNLWVQSPYVVMQAEGDPSRALVAAEQVVKAIDPRLPLRDPASMNERLQASVLEPRLRMLLFALIAGLALALAIVGIYGVMAYHVNQRRRETAIRRALGARVGEVVGGTIAMGLRLALAGIVLGAAGAIVMTRALSAMLFHVSPRDPSALLAVSALLGFAAFLACAVPAVRTARIDPASVLRDE